MSMLIENHKTTDLRNIKEPLEVRIATESYKKNNDMVGQFIDETFVKDVNAVKPMMLNTVHSAFRPWASQNIPKGKKVPEKLQVRAYMEKIFGAYPEGKGWKGVRFALDDDDEIV